MSEAHAERRWRAMGSDLHVIIVGGDSTTLLDAAVSRITDLEAKWSRFVPHSEIARLNAAGGVPTSVSADTGVLLEHARAAWGLSGGMFDPTLLDAIRAAGYDRSFDEIDGIEPHLPVLRFDRPDVHDIHIDWRDDTAVITMPADLGVDPGGIGKGLSADILVDELLVAGADGVCVNMGGDLRVAGVDPMGGTWTIGVDHPRCSQPIVLLGLAAGAVATSTTLKRTWTVGGERRHHLLDPQTLAPSTSDVVLATVVAPTAWQAEVLAKAALLRGSARAFDVLEAGMAALVVDDAGVVSTSDHLGDFTGGRAVVSPLTFDR